MGIDPPRGVLLYGKPGCGKTLLARAVANSAKASFFHLSASQLIQKYLGEGPKMVRNIFKLAAEKAPSIIFIDEIDAIGTKRFSNQSSGENEVQRTMIELLARLVLLPLLS
jgi:26S proteasome regulatory subunit T2